MSVALAQAVRAGFGLDLVGLEPVVLGADVDAEVWRGTTAGGTSYAVKVGRHSGTVGLEAAALLADVVGVPVPVPATDGRPWAEQDGSALSVVPWVEGVRAIEAGLALPAWCALGRVVRRVHDTVVPTGLALPRPTPHSAFLDRLARLGRKAVGDPGRAADLWRRAPVDALVDRADDLARAVPPAAEVLTHGDPHLGNVLVDHRGRPWLVDWDDACLAPREWDLMFVLGGVLADRPVGSEEKAAFLDGYGPVDVDPARLGLFLCTRALDDLTGWAGLALDGTRPAEDRHDATDILAGLLSPDGLVTLALEAA